MPLSIGLTGGIGSGKSTVAAMLVGRGAALVDTDAIAHTLTLPGGAAIDPIRRAFGDGFIGRDGALDRARMRTAAFSDSDAKRALETILHPLIGVETARQAEAARDAPLLVFDVPLLVESGRWRRQVDRVWLVDCSEALQIERVVTRSGWTVEATRAVIERQASRLRRRAAADAVITNEGLALAALEAEVGTLWRTTTTLA